MSVVFISLRKASLGHVSALRARSRALLLSAISLRHLSDEVYVLSYVGCFWYNIAVRFLLGINVAGRHSSVVARVIHTQSVFPLM